MVLGVSVLKDILVSVNLNDRERCIFQGHYTLTALTKTLWPNFMSEVSVLISIQSTQILYCPL